MLPIVITNETTICCTRKANFKNSPCIPNKKPSRLTFSFSESFTDISLNIACGKIKAEPLSPMPHMMNMMYAILPNPLFTKSNPVVPNIKSAISNISIFL